MNVVAHQAVRMQRTLRLWEKPTQVKAIKLAIDVLVEATLAIVSAVRDVYRHSCEHEARAAWHAWVNAGAPPPLTENVVCP
jgi:hypothetical protein